jgi:hypothetical protein
MGLCKGGNHMTPEPHPDYHQDYHAFKQIKIGGQMAIEDKAIAAYHKALDEGGTREEAERIFFNHFNKANHGKQG